MFGRPFDEYINIQKAQECQLVTAINAAVHLGEPGVAPDSLEYDRLMELVGAVAGHAIAVEHAHRYFGLVRRNIPFRLRQIRRSLALGRPVEVAVHHPVVHLHSVLIVGCRRRDNEWKVQVANFACETGRWGWMPWGRLRRFKSWLGGRSVRGLARRDINKTYEYRLWEWHRVRHEVDPLIEELGENPYQWRNRRRKEFCGRRALSLIREGRIDEVVTVLRRELASRSAQGV